jgi:hypothetical protein
MSDRFVLLEHGGFHIDPQNRPGWNNYPVRELLVVDSAYGYEVVWSSGEITDRRRVPAWRTKARQLCDDLNAWAALQ